jgi:hypothetical protein
MGTPDFETLFAQIDRTAVAHAINTTKGRELGHFEFEDAMACVFSACERWLVRDLEDMKIEGIEEEIFVDGLPEQRKPFHGFVDLRGTLTGAAKPYNGENVAKRNFAGTVIIADWKTTDKAVDTVWKERLRKSWQWKLYALATGAAIFSYRGISRAVKDATGRRDTNELILEVPESNGVEAREFLTGAFVQRAAYVDAGLVVWPRNRPGSCKAFGRDCPFEVACEEYSMPRIAPGDRQLSYSSISDLMLCPEKHRRKSLNPDEREETDSTIFGQAVHRGLEEVYRQAKEIQGV